MINSLDTRKGSVSLPCFFPVSTYGDRFPLDRLIRPYLPRLVSAYLVSYHYACDLDRDPQQALHLPLFIDSGGFALLRPGSRLIEQGGSLAIEQDGECVNRMGVLERQMRHADIGATLDYPIPPDCMDSGERSRRFEATLANAEWALMNNRRPDLHLFGSLQCWDAASAERGAQALARMTSHGKGFSGIAIGGLVPRLQDHAYVESVIRTVRGIWDGPIHCFGVGSPSMIQQCIAWGATSTDSSSYVQYAANGKLLGSGQSAPPDSITPLDRMRLALRNLAICCDPSSAAYPLSVAPFLS